MAYLDFDFDTVFYFTLPLEKKILYNKEILEIENTIPICEKVNI